MNKSLSVYLDLLRFGAALVVFVHHLAPIADGYRLFETHGDDAVMVFFVLSGFVIAHVYATKENTPADYLISRLARLYSVIVPALVATLVLDWFGSRADATGYVGRDISPLSLASNLTFLSQVWGLDVRAGSNSPFWSISYEFWYYIAFAVVVFTKRKALWLSLIALLVGPPIVLLAPIWILGVIAYRTSWRLTAPAAWLLFLSPLLYLPYCMLETRVLLTELVNSIAVPIVGPYFLHKAQFCLHFYVVGLLVGLHFIGAKAVVGRWSFGVLAQPIRVAAGYTFSLYLLHFPVLKMLAAMQVTQQAVYWLATAVVVIVIGGPAERLKGPIKTQLARLAVKSNNPLPALEQR